VPRNLVVRLGRQQVAVRAVQHPPGLFAIEQGGSHAVDEAVAAREDPVIDEQPTGGGFNRHRTRADLGGLPGKHVFLEKPMANTVEECDMILDALKGTDKFFMVGHICRFDTAYALAKEEIEAGSIGKIISMHAKRNLAKWVTASSLDKISALFGDGIHDFDLMMWYTGAKPKTVYAQTTNTRPEFKFDDIAWALFRLDDGSFAIIENIWSLPDNVPYAIDAKIEIVGTEGVIDIDNSGRNYSVLTKKGLSFPQSTYWPKVHNMRRGYLREEMEYFLKCILQNRRPSIITPQQSRDVVYAMRMAEKSAAENRVITF